MSAPWIFDQEHYDLLNSSRGSVLRSLLDELKNSLSLQSAIDVGCGLGHFAGFLKDLGFDVTAVDGRQQNVDEARRRHSNIRVLQFDAQDPQLPALGKFDLVLCFGLLYHLENPMLAIRHLKEMTGKLLLVEAVVYPADEPIMAMIEESPHEDQGLNHVAFYPTEACLLKMFYRAGFVHAYKFRVQPDHPDYFARRGKPRIRSMLAASHSPLDSKLLVRTAEPTSPVHPCSLLPRPRATDAAEKIIRFAKKPLPEKVKVIKRMVSGEVDQ